jgi:hypothetical protein
MSRHARPTHLDAGTTLAISVKANFGDAKVMPELKQANTLRGVKV